MLIEVLDTITSFPAPLYQKRKFCTTVGTEVKR